MYRWLAYPVRGIILYSCSTSRGTMVVMVNLLNYLVLLAGRASHARYQARTVQFVSAGSASGAALHSFDNWIYIFVIC